MEWVDVSSNRSKSELLATLRELHNQLSLIDSDRKMRDRVDDQTIDQIGDLLSDVAALVDPLSQQQPLHDQSVVTRTVFETLVA